MNITYKSFDKENRLKLFGEEDAGKEEASRLTSYYYKTIQYEEMISDIKFQIVTGEKGTGKSALLKMAYIESEKQDEVPIWIRMDDLSELYSQILETHELYSLKTLWKKSIAKLIMMKLADEVSFVLGDDLEKALKWAYDYGYSSKDFITKSVKLVKPIYEKYISLCDDEDNSGEHHMLARVIKNKKVSLYLDDFDLDWKGNKHDIIKIKSLLLALMDLTNDNENLKIRIALRTDVYEMIRNEEFSDKLESSLIKCKWSNQEIMTALAKRICTYIDVKFDESCIQDNNTIQYSLSKYLNYIFVDKFDKETRVWSDTPTHRVIYSLIRRKPRDMVKLCHSVAEVAYKNKIDKINARCFTDVLNVYSQERLKDLVNEYKNQISNLEKLLINMAPTKSELQNKYENRYVFKTEELYSKIKNIQNNVTITIYDPSFEKMVNADFHTIAHFLYKIGFITGRKKHGSGKILRVYYDDSPFLLTKSTGDKGYSWEIHPAYRGAISVNPDENWESTINMDDEAELECCSQAFL